jgi:porin
MAKSIVLCCGFLRVFGILLLLLGVARAEPTHDKTSFLSTNIYTVPQANPSIDGWFALGQFLGLSKETGIYLGGLCSPHFNWTISGGVRPRTTFGSLALALSLGVDAEKALGIPGGSFGVEFGEYTGGDINSAPGAIQYYLGSGVSVPHTRQELYLLFWHQRLFNNKLIIQVGKLNASGIFGQVLVPVTLDNPKLQDHDISVLTWAPSGYNSTFIARIPAYPNSALGAAVTVAPTKNFYASYGIFDNNTVRNEQTGVVRPQINNYKVHIGELGALWLLGAGKLPGRFGIGGWVRSGVLPTLYGTYQNGSNGFYLFANQRLWYRRPDIDNSGLIGFVQYGRNYDKAAPVNAYAGAGLTAVGLLPPELPYNNVSVGMAWAQLNKAPNAGIYWYPNVPSQYTCLGASDLMFQIAVQTCYILPVPRSADGLGVVPNISYTYIPVPGMRPDIPAAHALMTRVTLLF